MFLKKISRMVGVLVLILLAGSFYVSKPQKSEAVESAKAAPAEKIAVTPIGYDDIGDVLKQLGITPEEITINDLSDLAKLKQYEVVYINCAASVDGIAKEAAPVINQYVKEGGIVYASDFANSLIQMAFPGKIKFYGQGDDDTSFDSARVGSSGNVTAKIVDAGLASVVGKNQVNITFDLSGWAVIDSAGSGTKVHVTGPVSAYNSSTGSSEKQERPYVVSFSEGSGEVLYTSFHNEAQKTSDMEKLVNWFVIRTRASGLARVTENLASKEGGIILQQVVDGINQDETKEYTFEATGKKDFSITLNFGGSAIDITITDPKGKEIVSEGVSTPPYTKKVSAKEGKYTIKLKGTEIPSANYPFALAVSGDKEAATEQVFETATDTTTVQPNGIEFKIDSLADLIKIARYVATVFILVIVLVVVIVGIRAKKRKKNIKEPESK